MSGTGSLIGMNIFDVVIVGGRCAGAATALLLARGGLRVLVAERSKPGSDTLSGHLIKPDGVARLAAWGVLTDLLATGCPPITDARITIAGDQEPPPAAAALPTVAPRRTVLDRLLQDHARRAGAQVRYATSFRALDRDRSGNSVVTVDSEPVRTRLLVGADGRRSTVARAAAACYTDLRPSRSCAWFGYWDNTQLTGLRAELGTGVFAGSFPTHAGKILAFVQLPTTGWRPRHGEHDYRMALRRCPTVADGLRGGRLATRLTGARDLPTFFRQAAGPGWALVGDAAHHKDPFAARGIADAFFGAQLLTDHILAGWDQDLDEALLRYAAALTDHLRPVAELNDALATLDLPPAHARAAWRAMALAENNQTSNSPPQRPPRPHLNLRRPGNTHAPVLPDPSPPHEETTCPPTNPQSPPAPAAVPR